MEISFHQRRRFVFAIYVKNEKWLKGFIGRTVQFGVMFAVLDLISHSVP